MSGVALWTTDIGGYSGGDPKDPLFQELIVRWFQFGAFCPLFRLHGARAGGPPSNECGWTGGENEVWNLAKDGAHYRAMAKVMHLREDLRGYVADINREASETGLPMVRPLFLQFPDDPQCQGEEVEGEFMLGPDWLVVPITQPNVSQWKVYLPRLHRGEAWRYEFNSSVLLKGGLSITLDVSIEEFPLFQRISTYL